MDDHGHPELTDTLAEFELLVFGRSDLDDVLGRKLVWAEEDFTAHLMARLARDPVVLH